MLGTLTQFVEELRAVGVPVSMVEAIDAARALEQVDLADRSAFKAALGATLVKNQRHYRAFDVAFDVFFGLMAREVAEDLEESQEGSRGSGGGESSAGGAGGDAEGDALFAAILAALLGNDRGALLDLIREAVDRLSGMEPGRPVGGNYYFHRVKRRLGAERFMERLSASVGAGNGQGDELAAKLDRGRAASLVAEFDAELRMEIVRRLVADRGRAAVAKTLRVPLVEDLDLMHATRDELAQIERTVTPLAQRLATRLAQRRKRGRKGRLDVRRTIRRSLAHGGVLLDPRFRPPRVSKPELVLLCDVSGSMSTFARFTMQLTYAIGSQFSRVRSFAFIDGLDEVTGFFGPGVDFHDAMIQMGHQADLVWRDGHSDYGHAFAEFAELHGDAITPRSTVLITGDARNNYRATGVEILAGIAARARAVFWLNPESHRYWDTGDSVMSTYAPWCDGVRELRTLRQLEEFIEEVALPVHRPARSLVR